jgi:hypothetical protein
MTGLSCPVVSRLFDHFQAGFLSMGHAALGKQWRFESG